MAELTLSACTPLRHSLGARNGVRGWTSGLWSLSDSEEPQDGVDDSNDANHRSDDR